MNSPLTAAQQAWIEAELHLQQTALEREQTLQSGGVSRVEQAAQLLADDPDAPREHEGDREVTLELADRLMGDARALNDALLRLRGGDYGLCTDCGSNIPFDRLKAQPTALRCIACQERAEQR
ncbi:TraR/DksA family transcriptional regulator [Inhella gelatinilytica]|uniref:TraR/DksA family transcriptional regulator n=1 Tax=Inhella gelatinilytica TaxID=2795030 RepID=A0A931J026_9BURK|nr:TraR/DksA family transcriptional regulator [Inhella gelatinilytica]MBH9554175.1 TraR/DksA family transcriptional regulator [Inhella gelatinilytica]